MPSQIDDTKPVEGNPTTLSVRANFSTAKAEITALQSLTTGGPFLPLAGGRLTGPMYLLNDPTDGRMPATKDYVDTHGTGGGSGGIPEAPSDGATYGRNTGAWVPVLRLTGGALTGALDVGGNGVGYPALPNPGHRIGFGYDGSQVQIYVDGAVRGSIARGDQYLPLAGGTLTGLLTLSGPPTADMHAASKAYVDTGLALKAPLASPLFAGVPTAPTASVGIATAQIATCGFVANGFLPLSGGTLSGALNVNGAVSVTVAAGQYGVFQSTVTGARTWAIGTIPNSDFALLDINLSGTARLTVKTSGDCYNTTGTWNATSDARVKRDLADYTSGLAEVLRLHPVSFFYNGELGTIDDGATHYGLIAQEVEQVMPELVGEMTTIRPSDEVPCTVKTVDPGRAIYAVINAVRELDARVAALEGVPR